VKKILKSKFLQKFVGLEKNNSRIQINT